MDGTDNTDRQTDIATSRLNRIEETNEDVGLNRVKVSKNQKHKKNSSFQSIKEMRGDKQRDIDIATKKLNQPVRRKGFSKGLVAPSKTLFASPPVHGRF